MQDFLATASKAARKAGKLLAQEFESFKRTDARLKGKHEIVTRADLVSEETIIREIKSNYPSHSVLSEESGRSRGHSEFLWIVDPLDGTTNFSMHNPLWAVSIGLARLAAGAASQAEYELIAGVVYAPYMDELFYARKGAGAELNGRRLAVAKLGGARTLNTFCHGSKEQDIKRAVKYYARQKTRGLDCRQLGSASLELAFVAAGRVDSIYIPGANAWDVAAGVLLVKEAGGRVTDENGRPWHLLSRDMVASNGAIHGELIKAIKNL